MPNVAVSISGDLSGFVNVDVLIGPFAGETTITQFSPNLQDAPGAGGSVDVSIRNQAAGAGDSIDVSFAAGIYNANGTGAVVISAGGYAYLRVTAESGTPGAQGMGGFFIVSDAVPVGDLTNEPLTLAEVKAYLLLATALTEHDTSLTNLITRVRKEAERLTGISLVQTTVTEYMDRFPVQQGDNLGWWDGVRDGPVPAISNGSIELRPGNTLSVTSITTYNDSDVGTVFSASSYFVDTAHNRIMLRTGQVWPTVLRVANGVEVIYEQGWADPSSTTIPADMKERLMERVGLRWAARNEPDHAKLKIDGSFYGSWVHPKLGTRNLGSRH